MKDLRNMRPILAADNQTYRARRDAIIFGELASGNVALSETCSDFFDLFNSEFRIDICAGSLAQSRNSVCNVVGRSTDIQMVRIAARRVVAMVTDKQTIGDGAVTEFPCATRGKHYLAPVHISTIAMLVAKILPFPAFVGAANVNATPKLFWVIWSDSAVTFKEAIRLASSFFAKVSFLPTTAMAVTVWDFVRGRVRGMLGHVNSSFQLLTTPPSDSRRCGGNSFPASIIPQEAGI